MHARRLPARHGVLWLVASFRLFRANPPLLSALTLAYLFLAFAAIALPPIGPFLVSLASPAMVVVVANGCRAIERGRGVSMVAMTHGLKTYRIALVRLGGLLLLSSIILLFVSTALEGGRISLADAGKTISEEEMFGFLVRYLIVAMPVIAAFWFAPLLTGWEGVMPLKSLFFSLVACWRNWRAFALYGVAVVVAAVVLPGLLLIVANSVSKVLHDVLSVALMMVLVPVIMAGVYVSYQDVFHGPSEDD
jgi:hypothetical protein